MTDHDLNRATDEQLNRAVAEARGKDTTVRAAHDWRRDEDGEIDTGAWDGDRHNGPICARCGYSFCIHCEDDTAYTAEPCAPPFPDICSQPAAWGALLIELPRAPYHYRVALIYEGTDWLVSIYPPYGAPNENEVIGYGVDPLPGRALALAFVKARGI